MKFTDILWNDIAPIYQQIIHHPFNVELEQGILDPEKFKFYLIQDLHYLVNYARALAIMASKSYEPSTISHFLQIALETCSNKIDIERRFLANDEAYIKPSLACRAYSNHLLATAATGSIEEAMAAITPCLWIYKELGSATELTPNNPYEPWTRIYTTPQDLKSTLLAISNLDLIAKTATQATQAKMQAAFKESALYEWHFWNDAYNQALFQDSTMEDEILNPTRA